MADTIRIFPHRQNRNGDFDSVCPDCFTIISSQHIEIDLLHAEENHYCDPALLNALWGRKRLFIEKAARPASNF
jgi:hypothetical protein